MKYRVLFLQILFVQQLIAQQLTPEQQALVCRTIAVTEKELCEESRFNLGIYLSLLELSYLQEADTEIGKLPPGQNKINLYNESQFLHQEIQSLVRWRADVTADKHARGDNWLQTAEMFYAQRAWNNSATAHITAANLYQQARDLYKLIDWYAKNDTLPKINTLRAKLGLLPK